jgi:hypothetical protein
MPQLSGNEPILGLNRIEEPFQLKGRLRMILTPRGQA